MPVGALQCYSSPNYWILSAAMVHHNGGEQRLNFNIEELNAGDAVGCQVTKDGCLLFSLNGTQMCMGWQNLPTNVPLWGFADLYGRTTKIRCLGGSPNGMQAPKCISVSCQLLTTFQTLDCILKLGR